MPRGGKRPNSGPKKGSKQQTTLDKETLRDLYRANMVSRFEAVMDAQYDLATGVQHMMAKDAKTGQWIEVTDPKVMLRCLNSGETFYKIAAQNPNVQAQRDILDRLMDKPAQPVGVSGADGGPVRHVMSWEK